MKSTFNSIFAKFESLLLDNEAENLDRANEIWKLTRTILTIIS
jgi:hypothetical protein